MTAPANWCPTCAETTALVDRGICPWCDTPLVRKRRGGKPRGKYRRLSDAQLRALHTLHVEQGFSINQLAKRIHERIGYASHHSAAVCISDGWKGLGLQARDRIEQVRRTCTKHGMAPKHGPRPGYGTYRRRVINGQADQPRCQAVRQQPPRKGAPCQHPAMFGSEYCAQHDPLRELERQEHLEQMRARAPRREMLPMVPFIAWLHRLRAATTSYSAVAQLIGLHRSEVYRYAKGQDTSGAPKERISRAVVARAAANAGTTVDVIYAEEAIAA